MKNRIENQRDWRVKLLRRSLMAQYATQQEPQKAVRTLIQYVRVVEPAVA